MVRTSSVLAATVVLALPAVAACGSSGNASNFDAGSNLFGSSSGASSGSGSGSGGSASGGFVGSTGGIASGDSGVGTTSGAIAATIRDFKFYSAADPTTVPDFENPPTTPGSWDDPNIITDTIGADGKPVYANPGGTTLTTHGAADFNDWYNDVAGTNIDIPYMLPIIPLTNTGGTTAIGYDSNVQGVPYNIPQQTGDGFFPIDGRGFGNQGAPHNYSFTMELHTLFTYKGGETFEFRGDDDVFVFIDKKRVINLGGIHGPETASVQVDTLGLTIGQEYALDFFSAERHVTGSNIKFETTLQLRPAVN